VHAFRLQGHHLVNRKPKKDLSRVVGEIGGVQAQVMSAAELQVGVRVDCRVEDVRDALWKRKTLVKTWLMRGTLHLVPSKDLPIFTAAMSAYGLRNTNAWLNGCKSPKPSSPTSSTRSAIPSTNRHHPRRLIAKVGNSRSERVQAAMKSGWGGVLKPVARQGLLCFGPSRGQSVTFVGPAKCWAAAPSRPRRALAEVARRYLRAYGPATRGDFTRWWVPGPASATEHGPVWPATSRLYRSTGSAPTSWPRCGADQEATNRRIRSAASGVRSIRHGPLEPRSHR